MKRKFSGLVAVVVAIALAMAAAPAVADSPVSLTFDGAEWTVQGADVGQALDSNGEFRAPSNPSKLGRLEVNDRRYVFDEEGRPLALVSGKTSAPNKKAPQPTVDSISYAIDRDSDEIVMSWHPVTGADQYDIYVQGTLIGSTKETTSRHSLAGLALNDQIDVDAVDLDAVSPGEELLGTMTLIVSEFTLSEVAQTETTDGSFEVAAASLPTNHYFRFTTFIPEQYVAYGLLASWGCTVPSGTAYFGGDNRSWSSTSLNFRTRVNTFYYWGGSKGYTRDTGTTKVYNSQKQFLGSKKASTSGIRFNGPYTLTSTRYWFWFDHDVADPYCTSAAQIDFINTTYVDRVAGYNGFLSYGSHDRAPNFEMYYDDSTTSFNRFRSWTHGAWSCLSLCTTVSYNIVK